MFGYLNYLYMVFERFIIMRFYVFCFFIDGKQIMDMNYFFLYVVMIGGKKEVKENGICGICIVKNNNKNNYNDIYC